MSIEFCDFCIYLDPHEGEQKIGQNHICQCNGMVLRHLYYHPRIPKPALCPIDMRRMFDLFVRKGITI